MTLLAATLTTAVLLQSAVTSDLSIGPLRAGKIRTARLDSANFSLDNMGREFYVGNKQGSHLWTLASYLASNIREKGNAKRLYNLVNSPKADSDLDQKLYFSALVNDYLRNHEEAEKAANEFLKRYKKNPPGEPVIEWVKTIKMRSLDRRGRRGEAVEIARELIKAKVNEAEARRVIHRAGNR